MADQTQRLEIATVRAEVGSNILFRFSNDSREMTPIPTDSGDIKNLKQVVWDIQEDAADKISIATTIYPTAAAGLAATPDQSIFLVQSNDADEIYTVWKNESGTAVNTGKTALSATAIQTALDASNEAAQAAEDAADVAITRTARYLAPSATPPEVRDDGLPLEVGDVWFNTVDQTEYRYTDAGWRANESQQAIADLEAGISETPGSQRIPRANADGVLTEGWIPNSVARKSSVDILSQQQDDAVVVANRTSIDQKSMYTRRKVLDLPMKGQYHNQIISLYGYSYLYPVGLVVDQSADQVIVSYGNVGGSAEWSWWYVYRLSTGALLNCVRVEYSVNESMVIRYESNGAYSENDFTGASRYLYCSVDYSRASAGQSNVARLDVRGIENLTPLSAVPVSFPVATRAFSWMSWTGEEWIVQRYANSNGRFRRYLFDRYSPDFSTRVGTISTPFSFAGDVSGDNYLTSPKSQGFACLDGAMYCSMGAPFAIAGNADNNNPKAPGKQYGLACVGANGASLKTALCQADEFMRAVASVLDYTPNQCEAEGLSANNGTLYSLYVLLGGSDPGVVSRGIVIFEELSTSVEAIDFQPFSTFQRGQLDDVSFQARIHGDTTNQLCNPVTGETLTTWEGICKMMLGIGLTTYKFVGDGQSLTDFSGSSVTTTSKVFSFTNLNGSVFFVEVTGATTSESFYLNLGSLTQSRSGFSTSVGRSSLGTGAGFVAVNDGALGKITTYRNTNASASQYEFWNLNSAGTAAQLAGYISCNNLTTSYNTSSDESLKDDMGAPRERWGIDIVSSINVHKYRWKNGGVEDVGVFAQELFGVYPIAVSKGGYVDQVSEGGSVSVYYRPWSVDYSKLVVPIVSAMKDLIAENVSIKKQIEELCLLIKKLEG